MVLRHFQLREQPFGVTPDPRFLYASETHREALSSVLYGIESGLGFITLTAKPGMGKTTLLFEALRRLRDTTRTVFLFQTISTPVDLVHALLIDLGVKDIRSGLVEMQTQLNEILVAQCATEKRLVVAIDEAQNLDDSVLEAVRMLSNFETPRQKLMQIILSGQLQLAEKLAMPHLLQLRQRISIFGHLKPLSATDTAAYIQHRLQISGYQSPAPLFTDSAVALIAEHSEGIPRNINNICFNALSLGCALRRKTLDSDVIQEVLADLDIEHFDVPLEIPGPVAAAVIHSNQPEAAPEPEAPRKKERGQPAITQALVVEESNWVEDEELAEDEAKSKWKLILIGATSLVVLALFGWLGFQDYRALAADEAVREHSRETPSAIAHPPVPASASTTEPGSLSRLVKVREGQSLSEICTENFGKCNPEILQQIVKLNPSVVDPDHIQSGQRISIPIVFTNSTENE